MVNPADAAATTLVHASSAPVVVEPLLVDVFSSAGYVAPSVIRSWNEDRAVRTKDMLAVIDGTTALTLHKMRGMTPAEYCADFYAATLEGLSQSRGAIRTAANCLSHINSEFGQHLRAAFPEIPWGAPKGPSAGVLVLVKSDPVWSYAYVADCTLLEKRNGEWHRLSRDQFEESEKRDIAFINELMGETGLGALDVLRDSRFVQHTFDERASYNSHGRGVANGDPAMDSCIDTGVIDPNGLEALLLITDGLEWPIGVGEEKYLHAARRIELVGAAAYHQELMAVFDADPAGTAPLRLKHSDDATCIFEKYAR